MIHMRLSEIMMGRSKHSGPGARNLYGKESEQSKTRRKKKNKLTDEETVAHIRTNPTNRMPTKGTEIAKKVKKFITGK